jgi:hypothetical protein
MEKNIRDQLFRRFLEILQRNKENSDTGMFIHNIVNVYQQLFYNTSSYSKCPKVENGRRWTYIISFSDFVEKKEDGLFHIKNMDFIELSCDLTVLKDLKKLVAFYNLNEQHREQIDETDICVLRIVNSCFGFSREKNMNTCLVCQYIHETMEYFDIDINGSWIFEVKQKPQMTKQKRSLDERLYFPNHNEQITFREIQSFQHNKSAICSSSNQELPKSFVKEDNMSSICSSSNQELPKSFVKEDNMSSICSSSNQKLPTSFVKEDNMSAICSSSNQKLPTSFVKEDNMSSICSSSNQFSEIHKKERHAKSPIERSRSRHDRSRSPRDRSRSRHGRSRSPRDRSRSRHERSRSPRDRSRSPVRRFYPRSHRDHPRSNSEHPSSPSSYQENQILLDPNLVKNIIAMNSFLLKYGQFGNN